MKKLIFGLAVVFCFLAASAQAHRHYRAAQQSSLTACVFFCEATPHQPARRHAQAKPRRERVASLNTESVRGAYLSHPSGCPSRAFCGCGAMQHLGLHDRSLWLASSWYRFPRSMPAPNTVAVRPHHVFVLQSHVSGDLWLVADYNSGGHLSRLHVRSIAGYTIVRPT